MLNKHAVMYNFVQLQVHGNNITDATGVSGNSPINC